MALMNGGVCRAPAVSFSDTGPGGSWPTKKNYWHETGAVLSAHSPVTRGVMPALPRAISPRLSTPVRGIKVNLPRAVSVRMPAIGGLRKDLL